jgi:hypothetical protein
MHDDEPETPLLVPTYLFRDMLYVIIAAHQTNPGDQEMSARLTRLRDALGELTHDQEEKA